MPAAGFGLGGGTPRGILTLLLTLPRFVQLLDSVLWYLIPISEESIGTFNVLRVSVRWLLRAGLGAQGLQHVPVVPAFPLELGWTALWCEGRRS